MKITQLLILSFLLCLGTISLANASFADSSHGCDIPKDVPKKSPKK